MLNGRYIAQSASCHFVYLTEKFPTTIHQPISRLRRQNGNRAEEQGFSVVCCKSGYSFVGRFVQLREISCCFTLLRCTDSSVILQEAQGCASRWKTLRK